MQSKLVLQNEGGSIIPIITDRDKRASITVETMKLTVLSDNSDELSLLVEHYDKLTANHINYNRRILYPNYLNERIEEKTILFESFWGSQYSCNPRALYEYIDKNHPEYTCVWSLTDSRTPIKGNGIRVSRGSDEYYQYLAKAK